jgi:ribosomal protein L37AE/L43A
MLVTTLVVSILYLRKHKSQHFAEKDFRKQLMPQLVDGYSTRRKESTRPKRRRDAAHALEHTSAQGVCDLCRVRVGDGKHNKRSYWKCSDCDRHFCLPDCYNKHVQALVINTETDDE